MQNLTFRTHEAFGEALVELAGKFPQLVVLDADISESATTAAFAKKFPERYQEFGKAESNMIGAAADLARAGKIPVCASRAAFLAGRLENIRAAVILNGANVKLVGAHAGLGLGEDGPAQMGLADLAAMRGLPGLAILQPADALETRQAAEWMLQCRGPVYLRLTRQKVADLHQPGYNFRCGETDVVWEPEPAAKHLQATVFASGGTVGGAVAAARELLPKGFPARVVNVGTLQPFDADAVEKAASDSGRIVTVEDHHITGGLGSAACEAAAALGLGIPVVTLGVREIAESGTPDEAYDRHGIGPAHIIDACLRNLS